jgi:hypothetical protein
VRNADVIRPCHALRDGNVLPPRRAGALPLQLLVFLEGMLLAKMMGWIEE